MSWGGYPQGLLCRVMRVADVNVRTSTNQGDRHHDAPNRFHRRLPLELPRPIAKLSAKPLAVRTTMFNDVAYWLSAKPCCRSGWLQLRNCASRVMEALPLANKDFREFIDTAQTG